MIALRRMFSVSPYSLSLWIRWGFFSRGHTDHATVGTLAGSVIATVEDPVAVRQILAAWRPAETLRPGPPAPAIAT